MFKIRGMKLTKEIILQKLREIKPKLQQDYNLADLALFGSYARDEQTLQSDIDLMIQMRTPSFRDYCRAAHTLEDLFPETKVQIVSRGAIRPQYFEYVKQDLLYA